MWRKLLLVSILIQAGCSSGGEQEASDANEVQTPIASPSPQVLMSPTQELGPIPTLTNLGRAPELTNDVWLNSPEPLRLANLRGKVVLIEMWTFG